MAVFRMERKGDFTIMSNHHLRNNNLSLKAKGLLSLMLSLPEDWDYTLNGLARICKDGVSSIRASVSELEEQGYLRRSRVRHENGQLGGTEYTILEQPEPKQAAEQPAESKPASVTFTPPKASADMPPSTPAQPKTKSTSNRTANRHEELSTAPMCAFPTLDSPAQENRTQLNIQEQKTNESKTNSYPIHHGRESQKEENRMDSMEMISAYREQVMENIAYDTLVESIGRERTDEVLELIVEVLLSRRPMIRIAGDHFPAEAVKSRLMKVETEHVEYVFECLDKNNAPIRNIKAYLLTSLYNAPVTMDSFYYMQAKHDMEKKSA